MMQATIRSWSATVISGEMNQFFEFLCLILMLSTTNAQQEKTHSETLTKVVNHEFLPSSLSVEDKNDKKTLKELHTYAELKDDPRSSLPDSFTICSTAKTTLSETNGCQWVGDLLQHLDQRKRPTADLLPR